MRKREHRPFATALWLAEIFLLYTVVAVTFATESYVARLNTPNAWPWTLCFLNSASLWLSWALVTPLIVLWSRRWRFEAGQWRKTLLMHAAGILAVAPVQVAFDMAGAYVLDQLFHLRGWTPDQWAGRLPGLLAADFLDVPQMYAVIAGISYTVDYYRRYRERQVWAAQLEAQLAEARLGALEAQLRPHFLFNTLNAATALIGRDPKGAERVLTLLGDLLRRSLDASEDQEVPLRKELEGLGSYLEIERYRFPDRLRVEIEAPERLLNSRVPSFILQPLVENAVRHGISRRSAPGFVRIRAEGADGNLVLTVEDDGPGLQKGHAVHEGVGLRNTKERLIHLYGEGAGLELLPRPGGGALARITMPARKGTGPNSAGPGEKP